jgi:hypothetical protein
MDWSVHRFGQLGRHMSETCLHTFEKVTDSAEICSAFFRQELLVTLHLLALYEYF